MSSLSRGVRHEPLENWFLCTRESNGKQHTEKEIQSGAREGIKCW